EIFVHEVRRHAPRAVGVAALLDLRRQQLDVSVLVPARLLPLVARALRLLPRRERILDARQARRALVLLIRAQRVVERHQLVAPAGAERLGVLDPVVVWNEGCCHGWSSSRVEERGGRAPDKARRGRRVYKVRTPSDCRKSRRAAARGSRQSPGPRAGDIFRVMPFRLTSTAGDQSFELQDGATFVVGRASVSDLPVFDPTISRRHAELTSDGLTIRVRDLGSSNGTFVNGARVTEGSVSPGDTIAFGKVPFRVATITRPLATLGSELLTDEPTPTMPSSTIIRERPFGHPGGLSRVIHTTNLAEAKAQTVMTDEHAITAKKLALLLEVSKQLSRAADVDALLNTIASVLFQILDVDRVAIDLLDDEGTGAHARRISRDRRGAAAGRAIPQSIARKVVDEKVAVLSDNAPQDERFGGQSILMQSVRSAMCAPLIGSEDRVHGVLYVDNLTTTQRFDEDDLDFLVAFSNIAAV